ncbi:MAG: hypothetical protein ACTTKN_06335 [Phocaeicola sp.]|uniref:hypothetical protein n=1 Tax=Phocaeicola sp. TaxID=2773926 RepID=UPI003FA167BD
MSQYKQSEITNIYWASNEGFKGGRDPLGIQNSSIATYSKLLPGLTNLTRHIRYYSIYCWLLSEYDELEKKGQNFIHQYNFIRRAELAIALIMKDQGIGAIVGALFVSQGRYKLVEESVYNLADGADYESKDKYWTFKTGAFGQYYLGSLIYYELVKIEEGRFYLRNKGKELAVALQNSVDKDLRDLLLECIQDGNISEEEINELQPLAIHKTERESEEWKYLNHLLTKDDDNNSYRKDTIYLLLRDIENGKDVDNFVKNRFLYVSEDKKIATSFGWYFYYLCECLHYSIDTIFCLILSKVHELHNPTMQVLSQNIVELITSNLGEENEYKTIDEWRKKVINNIDYLYDELRNAVKRQDFILATTHAISLLLKLYTEFENCKKDILEFENNNDLKRQRGIFSEGLKSYVARYLSFPISFYLDSLIAQIMQEHTVVAIAKMGKNNSDLRKFIFEDGRIVLVEQRYPVETSPRINSLFNYLQDMSYIDSSNKLTDIAHEFIENYGKE